MGSTRKLRATLAAVSAAALVVVGVAGADHADQVETKLIKTEINGDYATGKVISKKKACKRKRKVILKGSEPLWIGDPAASSAAALVRIGTDRTNEKGNWWITPHASSYLRPGSYLVRVRPRRLGAKRGGSLCAATRQAFEA